MDRIGTRNTLIALAATAVAVPLMAVGLPNGTPPGLLMNAAILGLLEMLTAAGLVLIYRSSRVINFAQVALGAAGAALFYQLSVARGFLPYWAALPAALLTGPILGLIVGGIIALLFFRSPRLVLTIVTIIVAGIMITIEGFITNVFTPEGELQRVDPVLGPFPDTVMQVSGFPFRIGHLIAVVGALIAGGGLLYFLRRSRLGIAMRGTAENADRASLLGINVRAVSVAVWVIVGSLAALSSILALPITNYVPNQGASPTVLLVPLTAVVLARMTNLPLAMAATFMISIVRRVFVFSFPNTPYIDVVLFLLILVVLVLRRERTSARQLEGQSWKAQKEMRNTPRELSKLRSISWTRRALYVLPLIAALGYPWISTASEQALAATIMLTSMVGISLVILTGWSGQISLGQYALVAVGAFAEGILAGRFGIPMWFAVPISAGVGAGFAALVGIPALRVRGLFLAVTTLALAIVLPDVLLDRTSGLGTLIPDATIERPTLFFLDFEDPRSFYYLILLAFAAVFFSVRALRRGRTGRLLIALRDDEAGTRSFGVDAVRTRVSAFVLSGFIAGFTGALLVHLGKGVDESLAAQFGVSASIQIFIMTIIGGIGSVAGPILGAIYFLVPPVLFQGQQQIVGVLTQGLTPVLVLLFIPGGFIQAFAGMRDGVLRVIALRSHLIVPSLFADYSPEAWEERKAPLAPAQTNRGLAVLGAEQRYDLPSRLWGSNGKGTEKETAQT